MPEASGPLLLPRTVRPFSRDGGVGRGREQRRELTETQRSRQPDDQEENGMTFRQIHARLAHGCLPRFVAHADSGLTDQMLHCNGALESTGGATTAAVPDSADCGRRWTDRRSRGADTSVMPPSRTWEIQMRQSASLFWFLFLAWTTRTSASKLPANDIKEYICMCFIID